MELLVRRSHYARDRKPPAPLRTPEHGIHARLDQLFNPNSGVSENMTSSAQSYLGRVSGASDEWASACENVTLVEILGQLSLKRREFVTGCILMTCKLNQTHGQLAQANQNFLLCIAGRCIPGQCLDHT